MRTEEIRFELARVRDRLEVLKIERQKALLTGAKAKKIQKEVNKLLQKEVELNKELDERQWYREATEKMRERMRERLERTWNRYSAGKATEKSLPETLSHKTGKQRIPWKGQKQEWIFKMRKLYEKNPKRYKNPADTIKQEFPKYEFKGGWTVPRALNLLYKV
jgi:hypothetical protein